MKNTNGILSAILLTINPLVLPISGLIYLAIRYALGPELTDPTYRKPKETDSADCWLIELYWKSGQPIEMHQSYLRVCGRLGVDIHRPFASDHPLAKLQPALAPMPSFDY